MGPVRSVPLILAATNRRGRLPAGQPTFLGVRKYMENGPKPAPAREMEDALMYLPRKSVTGYRKGQVILDEHHPSEGLNLVVQGRVKVSIPVHDGSETVVDIFSTDDFFGESALLRTARHSERAVALDTVSLMSWS